MDWLKTDELIPLSWYKQMRDHDPVSFNVDTNTWSLFRYEDVKLVLADHEHFSSQFTEQPQKEEPIEASILRRDPPKQKLLRRLVSQAFTPMVIEALTPKIEGIAVELLDRMASNSRMDVVHDYASPLPIIVIAEMLGIPREDLDRFKEWSDALVGNDYSRYLQCQQDMSGYFADIIDQRRKQPEEDLISNLVRAECEGEKLSELELIGFCIVLLVAGNETTTNLITSAVLCLESQPSVLSEVKEDLVLLPQAIEEVLRYCSPVQSMYRRVKKAAELHGQRFEVGQEVIVWIGSANYDERVFMEPEHFDVHRGPNPHLAFGHGIHFCLGASLARLEAKIALSVLLQRIQGLRREDEATLERLDSSIVFGLKSLQIYWHPTVLTDQS
jgi:cytochrome P450